MIRSKLQTIALHTEGRLFSFSLSYLLKMVVSGCVIERLSNNSIDR